MAGRAGCFIKTTSSLLTESELIDGAGNLFFKITFARYVHTYYSDSHTQIVLLQTELVESPVTKEGIKHVPYPQRTPYSLKGEADQCNQILWSVLILSTALPNRRFRVYI